MAYFDNAATTFPKPQSVYDFMNSFYRASGGNAGRGNSIQAINSASLINETRNILLNLFHTSTRQIIFTPTATIALNMIIQGLIKKGCINIYISPFEHNAVTRTLYAFKDKILIHTLKCDRELNYNFESIKCDFETDKPDLVIVSHASNVCGYISPIEEIFSLAKKYNAITLVDMSQTAGLVDTNLNQGIIDFAVFAGHKTLYAPTGISGFVMKKDFSLPSVLFGGTGYESQNQAMPQSLPEKYEMGTLNILGIAGLNASLKWITEIGIGNIYQQEIVNRDKLKSILCKYDFLHLVGDFENKKYTGIISCLFSDIASDSAGNLFSERNISVRTGLQCAPFAHQYLGTYPAGTIRFSCSYFTNDEDFNELDLCLHNIEELL